MEKFGHGDYLEAVSDFQIIKLQYPGSAYADSAQYFLGECHYRQEEYLLAVEEYQALQRNFRSSPLVADGLFKIGMCYYDLSPKPTLDQTYTKKAIESFQSFIDLYPTHQLVKQAEDNIKELNNKLSQKLYDGGRLYMKMEYYKSAIKYFDAVMDEYHDTPFAEPAHIEKVKALMSRKHFAEAADEINKFIEKYPHSSLMDDATSLKRRIDDELGHPSAASAPAGH
jgi:outer membrane protein assembly factor BamD